MAPRHRGRRGVAAALLLLVAACAESAQTAPAANDCRSVAVYDERGARVAGIEDMAVDHARGLVYLSAHDRRAVAHERRTGTGPVTTGGLYIMAVSPDRRPDGSVRRLQLPDGRAVRPHGIALGAATGEGRNLYVIDRLYDRRDGDWILTPQHLVIGLDATGRRARRAESSALPQDLCSPNDLAAGKDALYVTNDHGACNGAARVLEDVLALSAAFVTRLDRGGATRVAGDLAFANGIALDAAGGVLTVAETRAGVVSRIGLGEDGARHRISLPGAPDNITRAGDGSLIVALHPDLLRFAAFRAGWSGARHAPSRVVRLRVDSAGEATVTRLFDDPGGRFVAGATAAAAVKGWLLIAGGYGDRMVVCRLAEEGA